MTLKIEELKFLKDYQIYVLLCNGHKIIYNLKMKLNTVRFMDLEDFEVFQQGEVIEKRIIRWNVNTEISLEEMLLQITERRINY